MEKAKTPNSKDTLANKEGSLFATGQQSDESQTLDLVKQRKIQPRFANFLDNAWHDYYLPGGEMDGTLQKLYEGANLWKVRGNCKFYNRNFHLDKNTMSLVAESKKWWSPGSFSAVPLIDVVEIREGWKTDVFNKLSYYNEKLKEKGSPVSGEPNSDECRCFSLIHGPGGREVLDLVANSAEEKEAWVAGLKHLVESVHSLHQDRQYDLWLRNKFHNADKDKNGNLNLEEIYKLVSSLNLKMDRKHANALFNQANRSSGRQRGGQQVLDAEEFVAFYHSLLKMPEIEALYVRYSNKESKIMSTADLVRFFRQEQDMSTAKDEDAAELIKEFELSSLSDNGNMSYDGFYHLLLSNKFTVYNFAHQKTVHQNMDKPLSHYYISSSHNTYLTGHQLAGESSVEGYISALKRGCRLVELDVWDGEDGEPIIYHGHTLTTKISLADVLNDAIKVYSFVTSPYPVILSVENHLSVDQQVVMVKQFKDILGDALLTDPVSPDIKCLPSPTELKNRILIKAKKPKGMEIESDDEEDDPDTIDYIDSDNKKGKPHKPMAPELREVVNVCEGKKFHSFASSVENDKCIHFPSLRENKAKSLIESNSSDFIQFTQRQISKIYPLGTRTSSSNLKPYQFWSVGAQVVTLNMQTEDKANFYNEALFRSNGNCGYVLKPDILLENIPYNPLNPPNEWTRILRVRVISAQHLPPSDNKNDIVDPYIQMKVRGIALDKQKQRTRTLKNNGFNPVWNEVLEARIRVPQVALVYFTVRDESSLAKDPVLALACIPFSSMKKGYGHVHLTDITGRSMSPAAVFVNVSISS